MFSAEWGERRIRSQTADPKEAVDEQAASEAVFQISPDGAVLEEGLYPGTEFLRERKE